MTEQPLPDSIGNRYKIESRIGEGGMGTVYKAHDSLLEIAVAIKKLHQTDSPDAAVRFQNEAVALGKLNHQNIARILDFANDSGDLHMVIEYLEGKSLSEVIAKERLTLVEVIEIFIAIADAMIHAHKNGVLHRDLKPSNIILVKLEDGTRVPKVVDFGIAKLRSRDQHLTATGVGIGSPSYMSPEQARNDNVDERSDIYSFACMMYETLTGRAPLRGSNALETIQKQISETPRPLNEVRPELANYKSLVDLIARALAKQPNERPQSFELVKSELVNALNEVYEALENSQSNESEQEVGLTEQNGPESPDVKSTRRKRLFIVASVGTIFLGLTVAVLCKTIFASTSTVDTCDKPAAKDTSGSLDDIPSLMSQVNQLSPSEMVPPNRKFLKGGSEYLVEGPLADPDLLTFRGDQKLLALHVKNCTKYGGSPLSPFKHSGLLTITLNKCNFDNSELECISKIPKLLTLQMRQVSEITDKGMDNLGNLEQLQVLSVADCDKITNDGLAFVGKLGNLNTIQLEGLAFTDNIFPYLDGCRNLRFLGLCETRTSPKALTQFVLKKPLKLLGVNQLEVDDELVRAISQSEIETANFKDTKTTAKQIEILSTSKHLSLLVLDGRESRPVDVRPLKNCGSLKELRLYSVSKPVPEGLVTAISELPLSVLWLEDCAITNEQLNRLAGMKSLRVFKLYNADVSLNAKRRFEKELKGHNPDCVIEFGKGEDQS